MKTAASIFKDNSMKIGPRLYVNKQDFIRLINEARKEALEEAAKRIDYEWGEDSIKASVLSLIHEIK